MSVDKKYIIDPFNCLCKIALLYFYPNKTRLSISNHVLYIQEHIYYQGLQRLINRDIRTDISSLNLPIYKFLKWYILDGPEKIEMHQQMQSDMRTIVKFAILGLKKMKDTIYSNDDTLQIVLQYLITMMNYAIENKWDEDQIVKSTYTNILSEKIKHNIDSNVVDSVCKNLVDANTLTKKIDDIDPNSKNIKDNVNILTTCVHDILKLRDTAFIDLMKQITTTL